MINRAASLCLVASVAIHACVLWWYKPSDNDIPLVAGDPAGETVEVDLVDAGGPLDPPTTTEDMPPEPPPPEPLPAEVKPPEPTPPPEPMPEPNRSCLLHRRTRFPNRRLPSSSQSRNRQ